MDTNLLKKVLVGLGIVGLMTGVFPGALRHSAWA
jgi:hypothetical protein